MPNNKQTVYFLSFLFYNNHMEKINNGLAIIGTGTIFDKYLNGLQSSNVFNIVAVCDKDKNKLDSVKLNIEKYVNYTQLIKDKEKLNLNTILIATPPKTHYEIAKYCLKSGINVLIEKPATITYAELDNLYKIARKNNSLFLVMFHWAYGSEVLYLKNILSELIFNFGKIKKFTTIVNDPYCDNTKKHILKDKIPLEGTWLDCGINCLSMINSLIKLDDIKYCKIKWKIDNKADLPYYSNHKFSANNTDINIIVNWKEQINFKRSIIEFENNTKVYIHHSDQKIYLVDNKKDDKLFRNFFIKNKNNKQVEKLLETSYKDLSVFTVEDRLHTHYYNFFNARDFYDKNNLIKERKNRKIKTVDNFFDNSISMEESLKIHKLLFEYNKK
ncbi:MAG: Gfo/Idh/MocA family oxidoreductase [Clostridiales bacterium]|nr:Gfo/Idh/MocA family oxidoreductase [Clostridiales bacterium]